MKSSEDIGQPAMRGVGESVAPDAQAATRRECCGHSHAEHHDEHAESGCCSPATIPPQAVAVAANPPFAPPPIKSSSSPASRSASSTVSPSKSSPSLPSSSWKTPPAASPASSSTGSRASTTLPSSSSAAPATTAATASPSPATSQTAPSPLRSSSPPPEPRYDRHDALTNLRIARNMGLPIFDAAPNPPAGGEMTAASKALGQPVVVADALLGTGLDRPATGVMADLITQMNAMKAAGCTLVAIDVPSGMDCDSGRPAADASGPGPRRESGPHHRPRRHQSGLHDPDRPDLTAASWSSWKSASPGRSPSGSAARSVPHPEVVAKGPTPARAFMPMNMPGSPDSPRKTAPASPGCVRKRNLASWGFVHPRARLTPARA